MKLPDIHEKAELLADLKERNHDGFISQHIIRKWFHDRYSTSKHLWVLYSIVHGLKSEVIVEVGFGRSTFVLAKAAHELGAKFFCCDRYDYRGYLSPQENDLIDFTVGDAKNLLAKLNFGVDFMFLDYLSSRERTAESCYKAFKRFLHYIKQNGVLTTHEAVEKDYNVMSALKKLRKHSGVEIASLPYNYGLGIIRNISDSKYGKIADNWKKKNPK